MVERKFGSEYDPYQDYTPVYIDKNNRQIDARTFAQLFKKSDPARQVNLAYSCLKQGIDPRYVLNYWVTDEEANQRVRIWCGA